MTVEAIVYISDFDTTLPAATDPLQIEGAAHIKGIKSGIKASFTGVTGPVTATHTELNKLAGVTGSVKHTALSGEWVFMAGATITGSPTNLDLVHGSGNIDFSTSYDQYLLELIEVIGSTNAELRLQMSVNAGSSFPANATGSNSQTAIITSGSQTIAQVSAAGYIPVSNSTGATLASSSMCSTIRIMRPVSGSSNNSHVNIDFTMQSGASVGRISGVTNNTSAQFNALRLSWSTGTWGNNGRYRLFGRRA